MAIGRYTLAKRGISSDRVRRIAGHDKNVRACDRLPLLVDDFHHERKSARKGDVERRFRGVRAHRTRSAGGISGFVRHHRLRELLHKRAQGERAVGRADDCVTGRRSSSNSVPEKCPADRVALLVNHAPANSRERTRFDRFTLRRDVGRRNLKCGMRSRHGVSSGQCSRQ